MTDPVKELLDSITADERQQYLLAALAERSRFADVGAICAFGELVFEKVAAAHHRLWLEEMLAGSRTVVTAPPESAKTTWGNIIKNAWKIGQHPELSYGICSAGDDAADDMTKAIADTIEFNPRWKLAFPNVVPDKQRGWSSNGYHVRRTDLADGEWERLRYGDKNPTLVGGGVGSARWNGLRLTGGLTLDDAHDRRSKTQEKTNSDTVGFFKDTAEFRVTEQATLDILQTRWNRKDIVALAKSRPDFKVFEHPAIITDENGVERSYWPEYHSLEKLQEIRERDIPSFELVFQGNDRAVEGMVLKAEWLIPFPEVEIRREWNRYFGLDPAKRVKELLGKNDDPDSFRLAVLADTGVRLVVEDVLGGVMFAPEAEDLFFSAAARLRPVASGIEVNGLGNEYYVNFLKRMRVLGVSYVLVPLTTARDMGERMSEVSPYFKTGQIMVSDAAQAGLEAFRGEWVSFPRGHDDTLSAVHLAWRVAGHLLPANPANYRPKAAHTNPFADLARQVI